MDIQITSRHEKASQSLQDTISAEFSKLEKYYDRSPRVMSSSTVSAANR